jgi:hypothetical protein
MSNIRIEKNNTRKLAESESKPLIIKPEIIVPPVKIGDLYLEIPYQLYIKNPENVLFSGLVLLLFFIQEQPIENKIVWLLQLENLSQVLDKSTAIKLIEIIPVFGKVNGFLDDKLAETNIVNQYTAIKEWLWVWEQNIVANKLQTHPVYSVYESLAMTSRRRYDMISALFARNLVDKTLFSTPEIAWILSECAIFWATILNEVDCKKHLHNNAKQHYNNLDSVGNCETDIYFHPDTLEEFLDFIDRHFEALARKCVENGDKEFDRLYFKPYIMAEKHWYTVYQKNKDLHLIKADGQKIHNRPGKRLGQSKKS